MKLHLDTGDRKSDLITKTQKARKVESKSLRDENSLHLSFSSDEEGKSEAKSEGVCDTERKRDRIEYKEIMITQPEKRTESVNEDIEENKERYNPEKTVVEINTAMTSEEKEPPRKESPSKMGLSIWEYLYWFTLRPKSLQTKKEIYDEGIKKINERLDIANLMKKLREIDKLRALLLDSDQLMLFNNLPKPEIGPKTQNYLGQGSAVSEWLQDAKFVEGEVSTKKQIINSFNNLKNKKEKTEVDKKLIEIFEENKEINK